VKSSIAIAGASGFVGKALALALRENYTVIGLSRRIPLNPPSLGPEIWRSCDLFSLIEAEKALKGVDHAFYLVHSMMPSARLIQGRFEDLDLIAADNFARAAKMNGVKRIYYLGGLLPPHVAPEALSRHLRSRWEVEQTLAAHGTPVTALRAGMVVGTEGSSFQMLVRLVRRLPIMICPHWTESLTQPIDIDDIVRLLQFCLENEEKTAGQTFDVGSPDVLTYRGMIQETSAFFGKKKLLLKFPWFTPGLSRLWVSVVTGAPKALVLPLVESLHYDMVAGDRRLQKLAGVEGLTFHESLVKALSKPSPHSFPMASKIQAGSSVRSVQRLSLPLKYDAWWAAEEYVRWLPQAFPFFIKVTTENPGRCHFSFPFLKKPLLILDFAPERSTPHRALFYIRGGLLVREPSRGRFEFRELWDRRALLACIHEFRPRLPWIIYTFTQAILHRWVMASFGRHLRRL